MGDATMPEEVREKARRYALLAVKDDTEPGRRDYSERIFAAVVNAASDVGYAAGRADERARIARWLTDESHPDDASTDELGRAIQRGEHLDD